MSKTHSYRIQVQCGKALHSVITKFADERGLSQSAAARKLVEMALLRSEDHLTDRLDKFERQLESILHAACAARLLSADAAQAAGSKISGDELKERISRLMQRYTLSA